MGVADAQTRDESFGRRRRPGDPLMPRRRKPSVPWLIVGPDPFFATCERCGKREPKPELPIPLDAAVLFMRYLVAKHRNCQPGAGDRKGR
jgi:hypothetical protein